MNRGRKSNWEKGAEFDGAGKREPEWEIDGK